MKTCGCGRTHSAEEWEQLKKVGLVGAYATGGRIKVVELRNCQCGSTIGVEVDLRPATPAEEAAA